jgi:multidrug resistance efflux pump
MTTSGVVAEVLIEEGDQVHAGDVLIRLKGKEDLQAAITAAEFEVQSAGKALDDLYEAVDTAVIQALEAITLYTRQVKDAQYQLDNFTVPSNQEDLEPMEGVEAMRAALDLAREAFEPYRNKSENDSTREKLKEDLDRAQSDYNAAVRRLEYINELEIAQSNLEKAKGDYATWVNGPDPAEVSLAEARINNANAALEASMAKLDDLELQALFSGTVSELFIHTGEWVVPGAPILLLADLEHLRVETTDLNEIDAARVKVGDAVIVTFDALVDVVDGSVKSISPKAATGSGVNYTAVIEMTEWPDGLRWGMTAFVDIEVE